MFVAERFLSGLIRIHGKRTVSNDDERTWYPQACRFLSLEHHNHYFFDKEEKSIIERTIQYIKVRTESFEDYFQCRMKNCKLAHV
ncbi:hypothetical protein [Candidatus Nitrosocosmicus sp. SS]|uniref:hypothetical protein n=1 Tax=Candidatus Nitrosocosmicus agrestis TaxID=2563600 RepID=UPI00122DD7A6|nr:hypothetical protein [Candidatus Nitrosocosmicus sp. SS]KAA2280380.1 hypothetical protein F1Z66_11335 [Candidatus Nitrosocosmicus sp. SS]KAF0868056.1 hypothetical protein E5N71_12335 [Candidatus Nitrosocosmicus sp. SS]